MKRIVLLLAVLLLGVTASAQEEKGIFTIQPKLGMNKEFSPSSLSWV